MKKYIISGLALSAILALTGCGSSDDSTATATTSTGYYVDSAVSGINYVCGDQNGTTDAEGMFKFAVGKDCTFKLGNIVLKTIASDNLVDQVTIVENNVSVARFLQTVDVDGDASNGIQITPETVEAVTTALADTTEVPVADDVLSNVVVTLQNDIEDYKGTVVTLEEAEAHLAITQEEVTKELLAGQTYYVVHISGTEHFVGKVSFNADVTSETWSGVINDSDSETDLVSLDGNKIIWPSDDSYSVVEGVYTDYVLSSDYNADGSSDGQSYLFATQDEAEAYYYKLYP